jgi:hypothetical protein
MLTAAAHLQHAITQNILDEFFIKGPADLIKAVEDLRRYGEGAGNPEYRANRSEI